jgi:hypothetical protein
MVLHLRRAAS